MPRWSLSSRISQSAMRVGVSPRPACASVLAVLQLPPPLIPVGLPERARDMLLDAPLAALPDSGAGRGSGLRNCGLAPTSISTCGAWAAGLGLIGLSELAAELAAG